MGNRDRVSSFLRSTLRGAGRQLGAAQEAYTSAREATLSDLPTDDDGRAKIVCRRHAERRAVRLDAERRPECFDPEHRDCRGCVEDIRAGHVETWE